MAMEKTSWGKEVDVVVVGYGTAGAAAAITAHDAGAEVLILEKGKTPGGLSIFAGGGSLFVTDVEQAIKFLTKLSDGKSNEDVIRSFAEGMAENLDFAREMAKTDNAEIIVREPKPNYIFEGGEALPSFIVGNIPGFSGFPWITHAWPEGLRAFKLFMDNVESRKIEVMLQTSARKLIRDIDGQISGVIAENEQQEFVIKARMGVILACGGFEQSEFLKVQYLRSHPIFPIAPPTHTGDGITMSQEVGAALWHMPEITATYGMKLPDFPVAFPEASYEPPARQLPWIVVNKLGRRYLNEEPGAPEAHFRHISTELFDPVLGTHPAIPSYMIFDDDGKGWGPIVHVRCLTEYHYEWSHDNSREIEKGWIISADTIPQLAEKIKGLEDNEGLMEAAVLVETVEEWNRQVEAGSDPFGRPSNTMTPLKKAPFYAAAVWPVVITTFGGPAHNGKQQILDVNLQPIRRLYAAGELGSFFSGIYQSCGHLGECITSGRIAGRNAAQEIPWSD